MASNAYFSSDPYRRHPSQTLNHKVSNLSESSDSPGPLRGRESLVSLQSFYDSPPIPPPSDPGPEHQDYGRGQWSVPFMGNNGGRYQPVSPTPVTFGRFRSFRGRAQDTIHEDESMDMTLLGAAVPPAHSDSYSAIPKDEPREPAFDMTSFSGPMGVQDQEFLKSLQEQEANGKLTGGLGQGVVPNTTIKSEHLFASTPSLTRSLTRSLSMRRTPTLNARPNWQSLGQEEANKRGEVIEVIMEEHADVDISSMIGPHTVRLDQDVPAPAQKQVFYPQPDWRPFSMRWPYLLFMILLSVLLGIGQELVHQMSRRPGGLFHFTSAKDLDPGLYFVFKFVPAIITVTYGVLWQNTDFEVRRLEAFYQMSKNGGALAAESINVDYITLFNFTRPLLALHRRHYAVVISSVATLLAVSLVPTLGAASLVLSPDRTARLSNPDELKVITTNAILSRVLTGIFFGIAILGCILFYQLTTRRSGLQADVKGIAGLASMAVVSHIMTDFKDMDTAKPKDIHHKLKNRRYELRNSSLFSEDFMSTSAQMNDRYKDANLPENPHPLMLRKEGCIPFIIGVILFLILIPVFLFTPASVITIKAPWAITALAVCIKLSWGSLETSIRMLEPYYILAKRHAPAKTLTLDYTAMPFAVVALRALFNRHWIVFLVGWGTILVEGLTIFATSLAQVEGKDFLDLLEGNSDNLLNKELGSGSETVRSFVITLALTVFILLYICIVAAIVFVRRRRPFLPRQPNTIASVLAFMHQSKMLYNFVGTTKLTNTQMREKLEELGKTYGLGWFNGRDGQMHCGVDEEELTGNYKHGVDYSQGNMPWLTDWQTF
ncbi:hypothetical protein NUW58_g7338 [Xylaria curta]|uniref:Uncharacterized protein n=1 Tax=Xylaria curta TaxID=42375 RepID=A0ACC1NI36_9PEZI|nr:hypothetical protein NUW58_g7338 [Xylaria curta]